MLNISYDLDKNTISLDALVASQVPASRLGIQSVMNKLVGDLLSSDKRLGKLKAILEERAVKYFKHILLDEATPETLMEFVPLFIEEVLKWRKKFQEVMPSNRDKRSHLPYEVVSFEAV